jgi:hypothetical protein
MENKENKGDGATAPPQKPVPGAFPLFLGETMVGKVAAV